jgi:hypothetical protein
VCVIAKNCYSVRFLFYGVGQEMGGGGWGRRLIKYIKERGARDQDSPKEEGLGSMLWIWNDGWQSW